MPVAVQRYDRIEKETEEQGLRQHTGLRGSITCIGQPFDGGSPGVGEEGGEHYGALQQARSTKERRLDRRGSDARGSDAHWVARNADTFS